MYLALVQNQLGVIGVSFRIKFPRLWFPEAYGSVYDAATAGTYDVIIDMTRGIANFHKTTITTTTNTTITAIIPNSNLVVGCVAFFADLSAFKLAHVRRPHFGAGYC